MMPKAKLLIIGGAEDKVGEPPDIIEKRKEFTRYEILNELLPGSSDRKIEIITTGSEVQDEVKKIYQKVFRKIGYNNVGFMPINDRMEARKKNYLSRAEDAGAIFFTGGDQFRLSTILGGTPFIDIIRARYFEDSELIIAGTSAGAMAMSTVMIMEGGLTEALLYRNLSTSAGLGFLPNCIIDTHFIKRGRFGRLAHAIIMNPEKLGIGLGEDTALIIKNGTDTECRGSGMVVIIDGREICQTNITSVSEGEAVFVENLRVHLLVKGCQFSMETRKLANPAIPIQRA
ncbi:MULTISPECIES: cyanophycinase [Legionella]|uniref:Cyanophycinase n=1 Tax=Legionella septentrionalis TaxID=2498109 RepID=A0A3S0WRI3_9GAMM|nr:MULTISPECIES: cyanophycinase [Legionella]MCP0912980.1 cyanophycinase [Legionella sp. 27cVA30]RUQ85325.1 cyanophycinase [Legionella septentrionalis]RUQ96874.1 cyanophycinase [Legionella septentrionalis]RUR10940.1 cyanophycinase [Legionella septentrionalis]RUR15380.1 cyanophycinase [Legionella septentrionalis]